ncbi:MAG: MurT ligase domain-containing protein [Clostridia bacterium]
MGLRRILALAAGKISIALLRALGRGATTAPGRVVLWLDSAFVRYLARDARRVRAVVTGTNGKTTTAALLESMMDGFGWEVLRNSSGSNMLPGIASAMAEVARFPGRLSVDAVVAEVDEATMPRLVEEMAPEVAVVTNFFRDQLDRYGELDHTVSYVREGLAGIRRAACLNVDDPLVAGLMDTLPAGVEPITFGFDPLPENRREDDAEVGGLDTQFCPRCGERFQYRTRNYGHLGDYSCPGCGWSRPEREVVGVQLPGSGGSVRMRLEFAGGESIEVTLAIRGAYNAYNAVAAAAAARVAGVGPAAIKEGLEDFGGAFGRMERLNVGGREVVLALSKNPVGFNQILRAVLDDAEAGSLVVGINDNLADGRDISWLWDVDFELLAETENLPVVVTGTRAEDMAVRLKYGGVETSSVEIEGQGGSALKRAVDLCPGGRRVYALLTYTAMLDLRGELQRRGLVREMWRG